MNRSILLILSSLMLISCADSPPRTAINETKNPALHVIHNNKLHDLMDHLNELMGRMNVLSQERFLTEPELDAEYRKSAKQISTASQNLLETIDVIPMTLPSLQLSATEKTTFLALVAKLREQIQALQIQTTQHHPHVISNSLTEINTTCASCHALFRKQ